MSGVRPRTAGLLLLAAFGLRLSFGLSSEFRGDDQLQIFLIGLRFFATGEWPYFGPDVVYTRTQVPGALQGLLVGGPLWFVAQPEAPYVLLNLLSFAALVLLAVYIRHRVPEVPAWFVWPWLLFSPWTLNISTNIVNLSYVLTGAVMFFVGMFELLPVLSCRILKPASAFFLMGFGLLWVAQLHLSFPLLIPFGLLVLARIGRDNVHSALRGLVWFVLGALVAGSTLVPTLLKFGVRASASAGANVQVTPDHLLRLPQLTARFLSFASFELPRFIGSNTAMRFHFLASHPWAAPFALFAAFCGLMQPFILFAGFFRARGLSPDWIVIRRITLLTLGLLYVSFAFSVVGPISHTFYLTLPVAMVYSFYCWRPLLQRRVWRVVACCLLISGFVTHAAIAVDSFKRTSLYTIRPLVMKAIRERNYQLLGERRSVVWERERKP